MRYSVSPGPPESEAEPQTSAPDQVEKPCQPGQEPGRDDVLPGTVLGLAGHQHRQPGQREHCAHAQDHARAAGACRAEDEWQQESHDSDQIPGHGTCIGAAGPKPEASP
jgi:hypothetical protein